MKTLKNLKKQKNSALRSLLSVYFFMHVRALGHIKVCVRKSLSPAVVHQDTVMSNDRSTLIYHAFSLSFFMFSMHHYHSVFHMVLEQMTVFLSTIHNFTAIIFPVLLCVFFSFGGGLLRIRESFRMSRQSMSVLFKQFCR